MIQLYVTIGLFTLLGLITVTYCLNIINTEYISNYSTNQINLIAKTQSHQFKVSIDLTANYTWLYPNSDSYTTALTILNPQYEYEAYNKTHRCIISQDSFYLKENRELVIDNLTFLIPALSPKKKPYAHGVIGLNYHNQQLASSNASYSFIHQLKHQGFIDHLSFGIYNNTKAYFGGLPPEAKDNKTHSYCNILLDKNGWSCSLHQVTFAKPGIRQVKQYEGNETTYVRFTTDHNRNYAPKAFMDELYNKTYQKEVEENRHMITDVFNKRTMYYFNRFESIHGNVTFAIEDYVYTIPLKDFWLCDEDYCDFTIYDNNDGDYWVLGSDFFLHFNMEFDFEGRRVDVYSVKGVVDKVTNSNDSNDGIRSEINAIKVSICLIVSVLLLIGIGINIVINNKWKQLGTFNLI